MTHYFFLFVIIKYIQLNKWYLWQHQGTYTKMCLVPILQWFTISDGHIQVN